MGHALLIAEEYGFFLDENDGSQEGKESELNFK